MSVPALAAPVVFPWRRAALFGAAALLVLAELAALALAAVPRVSEAYAAYYIKTSVKCYLDDGLPQVALGRTVGAERRYAISRCTTDKAWAAPLRHGTVLARREGTLSFRLHPVPATDLRLTLAADAVGHLAPPTIEIDANGQPLGSLRLTRSSRKAYTLVVPRSALTGDRLDLTFRQSTPIMHRFSLLRWRLDPIDAPILATLDPAPYY